MNTGSEIGKKPLFGLNGQIQVNSLDWTILERTDWAIELQNCMQEPEFHAEGDVWTHTQMVVNSLLDLPEYQVLPQEEQTILLHAAILHDVAKPACTVIENGQIRSPKHSVVGEKMARDLLWDHDFAYREKVCSLVRLHGLPVWGLSKKQPTRSVILSSWRVRNELTYLLAKADMLGRISSTAAEHLAEVELFRELCLESECFEQARPWFDAHSRYHYYWSGNEYPAQIFDDTKFEIVLMAGIPGSGKDTFIAKNYPDWPQISLDQIRRELKVNPADRDGQGKVAQLAYERAKAYARQGQSLVWNSTNLSTDLRARLIQTLAVYKPRFKLIYLESSREKVLARRKNDIKGKVMNKMFDKLDIPLEGEAHELQMIRN
jgi:predicted kinase